MALGWPLGEKRDFSDSIASLATIALEQGDAVEAGAKLRQSLVRERELGRTSRIPSRLDRLAGVAGMQGNQEQAARLYGAAEGARTALGITKDPIPRARTEHHLAAARAQLGAAAWATAWAAGRTLSQEQAIAEALAIPEAPADTTPVTGPRDVAGPALSPREREVAALVAEGRTNGLIAAALGLATRTVDTHVARILKKLGVASRAEVVARLPREHPTPLAAP